MNLITPKNWNQLTTPQLEWLQSIYDQRLDNETHFLTVVFLGLMGIVVEKRPCEEEPDAYYCHLEKDKNNTFLLRPYEIHSFSQKFKWLLQECKLTRSPYPYFQIGKKYFRGPANKLADFSWKQYKMASDFYTQYMESIKRKKQDDTLLYKFIATLFTPKIKITNPETEEREDVYRYVPNQFNNWKLFQKQLSEKQIKVILMFWNGCCHYLSVNFKHLFRPASKMKTKTTPEDLLIMEASTTAVLMDRLKITSESISASSMTVILKMLDIMQQEAEQQKEMMAKMKH